MHRTIIIIINSNIICDLLVSLLTLIVIDLDWHVHQKDNHEIAMLLMTCQRGWKTIQYFRTC
jgi:hypothetical protein